MNLGRAHELIPQLIEVSTSPYKRVSEFAQKSLVKITGEKHEDIKEYTDWARRWKLITEAGKKGDMSKVGQLREMLRDDQSILLKQQVLWALQRMLATEAIGDIIDQLDDDDADFRSRVYRALKFISFKDLPYDPTGSAAARRQQIEAWRAWHASQGGSR